MAEYIDRIAFREKIDFHYPFDEFSQKDPKYDYAKSVFLRQLAAFPAADVVERKTGKWIYDSEPYPLGNPYWHYACDQCGESVPTMTNLCPNCGAKMEVPTDV